MHLPTERFTDRVDAYVRSRPSYPAAVLDLLRSECGLRHGSTVADVGSGTGIFTHLLLEAGFRVFAVEPNAAMRGAAERLLQAETGFRSLDGTAENTGLDAESIDLVAATQSFHWFDQEAARREFRRIVRPGGWIAIIWNERIKTGDAFHTGYERVVSKWGTDYATVDHSRIGEADMRRFFDPQLHRFKEFGNAQILDWEGLKHRLLSSSFAPNVDSPECAPMLAELETLFRDNARDQRVTMQYRTLVYYSRIR